MKPSGSAGWELRAAVAGNQAADAEDWLLEHGALAVTMLDAGDHPVLEPGVGETPLWPEVVVVGFFDEPPPQRVSPYPWQTSELADQPWERAWMERFEPMDFGHGLWIVPSHHQPPPQAQTVLMLDPGLAFGAGTHPTTALCLRYLAAHRPPASVLDYGCGSGVLALAARLLGASAVYGVDNDPQALEASAENARRNGVEGLRWQHSDTFTGVRCELVMANILASVLIELAPLLARTVLANGTLVMSGLLDHQANEVVAAYPGFAETSRESLEGWTLLELKAPG